MLACFSRQRVVGGLIVVLAVTLCVAPLFSRGHAESVAAAAGNTDNGGSVNRVAYYPPPPASRRAPDAPPDAPSVLPPPAADFTGYMSPASEHVVESRSFQLVSTKYRLTTAKAKALAQFLEEQVGRPEIFEISVEEPEAITVVASPSAQKTVGELLGLMRTSPGKAREPRPVLTSQ